ncbi:MAG TPA: glycosyltransferase family 9 protein [Anaerolineales bacterium]|nr:glycosyltransferase family 9 protein [Anaerolineales bacterium]
MSTHLPTARGQLDVDILKGNVPRVLAMGPDNIGDVVLLAPALRALRESLPQAEISLIASSRGSQVASMLPWVDHVLVHEALWQDISPEKLLDLHQELELIEQLRERQFSMAVIFTSFSQSPFPAAYACYLAGIPYRVGFSKEFGGGVISHFSPSPDDELHQVDRNLKLLETIGIHTQNNHLELYIPDDVQERVHELLYSVRLNPQMPFIVLAPGAGCSARRYDPLRFAEATRILAAQTELHLVVVGNERESESLEPVLQLAEENLYGNLHSLVGKTSVPELVAILRQASLTIAHHSAPMHIADAVGCPMIILYSGTDLVSQWMPRHAPARLLCRPVFCSPCYNYICPFDMECLDIRPEEVAIAALEMLDERVFRRMAIRRLAVEV